MFRPSWKQKSKENARGAFEFALQLAQDQELRTRLSSALEHAREARHSGRGRRLTSGAKRLAADKALQAELRDAAQGLQEAYVAANAKRRPHRLRRIVSIAGLASLAAVPQVRERLSALLSAASRNTRDIQATNLPGARKARPHSLDDLTKEELYARAQEAEIAGRSEMSKDELVAALRANGS